MKLILLGAPGAGKGTQSAILSQKLNVPTVATGNILRAAMEQETPLGEQVRSYMNEGRLVPDDTILNILAQRLAQPDCINGFILDGVPRTVAQAEDMAARGVSDGATVIAIEITDEEIQSRVAGRRVCARCGASYHVTVNPPKTESVCDTCGGPVIQRVDDAPELALRRLQIYREGAEPLKEFYRQRGVLVTVYAAPNIEGTSRAIAEALGI